MAYVNAKNLNTIIGRIPNFKNKEPFTFKEAQDENHSDFIFGQISVDTSQYDKESGYNVSCLHEYKAWGHTAKFIHDYLKPGQEVAMTYELRKDAPYEKDGETVYPGTYLYVVDVRSVGPRDASVGNDGGEATRAAKPAAAKKAAPRQNPLLMKKHRNVL